jgi:hypothetical protein
MAKQVFTRLSTNVVFATLVMVLSFLISGHAQWVGHMTPGLPRAADGNPNLRAPTPRTADGKPALSGVWHAEPEPGGEVGPGGLVLPKYMANVTRDQPADILRPAAAALFQARAKNFYRDSPSLRCLPLGVAWLDTYTHPFKIVQTAGLIVILYESQTLFRQVFVDGRTLPDDPQPAWLGYSVGAWDGDALVVKTAGFTDKTWLDARGHPHSEAMRLTERFTRRDTGHLDIEVTVDDPANYTRPFSYTQPHRLLPDGELIEYICNENNAAHFPLVGDQR